MNLQTLRFNSTKKTVSFTVPGAYGTEFENIPTVKILDGYYEVMQKQGESVVPILRVPIANTNMFIEK